jgi:DNA-binding NarL/FixJ family response regulator
MNELRVLLVADDLLVRTGLASLLSAYDTLRVVGQSSGQRLGDDIDVFRPHVILWDLGWTSEPARRLAALVDNPLPTLALLGDSALAGQAAAALSRCGVYGVLQRDAAPVTLVTALNAVGGGLVVFSPLAAEALAVPGAAAPDALAEALTTRETEVLQLMAQGLTNKAIGLRLGITDHTVKFHVNAIMTKLSAQSRTDAVIRATRAGLVVL